MTFDPRRWRAPGVPPSYADPADETAASWGRIAPFRQTPPPTAAATVISPLPVMPFGRAASFDAEPLDAPIATSGPLALQAQARLRIYGAPDILTAPMPASGAGNLPDSLPDTGSWPLPQLAQFTAAPPPAAPPPTLHRERTDAERDDAQRRQADQPCLKERLDAMAAQQEVLAGAEFW